jgi:hypothetical protein
MKGDAWLLTVIADVDAHLELLSYHGLDGRGNLLLQCRGVYCFALLLTE